MAEVIVGIIAVAIAIWQLNLQRKEIRRNGQINSLIHVANMIQQKIEFHEKIIQDLKKKKDASWRGHETKVNKEFRPLLSDVNQELLELMSQQNNSAHIERLIVLGK